MTKPIRLVLPYAAPPLTENQRMHFRQKAALVAAVRQETATLARCSQLPRNSAHVAVSLHYAPTTNHRRDADNIVPTLKAACDGLVDAGIVSDDTPREMTKHMPVIHPKRAEGGLLWLEITIGRPRTHCFVCHRDDPGPRPHGCGTECHTTDADQELADTIAREDQP